MPFGTTRMSDPEPCERRFLPYDHAAPSANVANTTPAVRDITVYRFGGEGRWPGGGGGGRAVNGSSSACHTARVKSQK